MTLVPEGSLTHRGTTGRPLLLDHIFVNMAFLENPFFPATYSVSFEKSISSNHTALFLDIPLIIPPTPPPIQTGWIIEDQMEQEWKEAFTVFPCPLITDIVSLTQASEDLITLTNVTCDKFFAKKMSHMLPLLAQSNSKLKERS